MSILQEVKYGNTKTYLIKNGPNSILIDTDWAGTLPSFFYKIKILGIKLSNIKYLLITHYHPDHMGIAQNLIDLGMKLIVMDVQEDFVNSSDRIFEKENRSNFKPIGLDNRIVLTCNESRSFLSDLGIKGEIIHTPGHSEDSISIILDTGIAIVGDLYPLYSAPAFESSVVNESWNKILMHGINTIYYGHAKEDKINDIWKIEDIN